MSSKEIYRGDNTSNDRITPRPLPTQRSLDLAQIGNPAYQASLERSKKGNTRRRFDNVFGIEKPTSSDTEPTRAIEPFTKDQIKCLIERFPAIKKPLEDLKGKLAKMPLEEIEQRLDDLEDELGERVEQLKQIDQSGEYDSLKQHPAGIKRTFVILKYLCDKYILNSGGAREPTDQDTLSEKVRREFKSLVTPQGS